MIIYNLNSSTKRGLHVGEPFFCLESKRILEIEFQNVEIPSATLRLVTARKTVIGAYPVVNGHCDINVTQSLNVGLLVPELFLPSGEKYTCSAFEVKSLNAPSDIFNVYPHIDDVPSRLATVEETVSAYGLKFAGIETQLNALPSLVYSLQAEIEDLKSEIASLTADVQDLYTRVGDPLNI